MNFFKKILRKIFRRPAILFVTLYANHIYQKGVKMADERHAREHKMIYLAKENFRSGMLTTYDKRRFKTEKRVFGHHARLLTMTTLKRGCYYHTPDAFGCNGMSEESIEKRRQYFVRERLRLAGLI